MKKLVLSTAVASALAISGAVNAQQQPQQQQVVEDFSGWYLGGKAGWGRTSLDDFDSGDSWRVGAEVGYNWQLMHGWVIGVNGFYDYNASDDQAPDFINGETDLNVGSHVYGVDGKLGFAAGPALYYGKLGIARVEGRNDLDGSDEGLHAGLGVEFKFQPEWSVTGEWTYTDADIGPNERQLENHNFTVGVNFHF